MVGHGQLWGWRGTRGSQKSWLGKIPESPSPVLGAEAVRGARERQLWGWRKAQGRQRRWAGLGPKAPLCVGETAAGSGMSWRATVAAPSGATAVALIVTPWASERAGTSPLSRTSRSY